jgi:hypothetical protein
MWTSSLDGALGPGAILNLKAALLTEGTHIMTVAAINGLGLTNSASVKIHVLREPPPSLEIQLTRNQVLLSWPSSVTNYVLESTLDLAAGNWTPVTNAPFAADAQQTVTVDISATLKFYRLIKR